jgi:phosphatidylglycerophosphatase C
MSDPCVVSVSHPSKQTIAVFDFDGTLTRRDSLFPFLAYVVGIGPFLLGLLLLVPAMLAYAFKRIPNWVLKERFLTYFLAGREERAFFYQAETFALTVVPKLLRPETLACLRWHQAQGHPTFLVSASMEAYLQPWAASVGIDHVLGTQIEVRHQRLTGKLLSKNCYGPEKVARLQAKLGDLNAYCIYAYGDSKGDRDMLQIATHSQYRKFYPPNMDDVGHNAHYRRK